eukprot:COSAG06_NODE_9685_length_1845_cov_1.018900_1_plen_107_part_10
MRKLGRLLGTSKIYDALARETWLGGDAQLQGRGEVEVLRVLKAELLESGASEQTMAHVDERISSLIADQVATLAAAELRIWLQPDGGKRHDDGADLDSTEEMDEVSR